MFISFGEAAGGQSINGWGLLHFEQILKHMPETEVDVRIEGLLLWWVMQLAGGGVMQASSSLIVSACLTFS